MPERGAAVIVMMLAAAPLQAQVPDDAPPPPPALSVAPVTAPAGALLLDDDRAVQSAICDGRDVLIHGSFSRFTIMGACRSVTVQGREDRITVQVRPGARIAVGGDSVTLRYSLSGAGADPVLSVTGNGSTATHIDTVTPPSQAPR